jgi:hypothetical protein
MPFFYGFELLEIMRFNHILIGCSLKLSWKRRAHANMGGIVA